MTSTIHHSKVGTYHPKPGDDVAWTVNDTRGYIDGGPACDKCGACECASRGPAGPYTPHEECVGLSFAYVCLDGGDTLCEDCFEKQTDVCVVPCDCR